MSRKPKESDLEILARHVRVLEEEIALEERRLAALEGKNRLQTAKVRMLLRTLQDILDAARVRLAVERRKAASIRSLNGAERP